MKRKREMLLAVFALTVMAHVNYAGSQEPGAEIIDELRAIRAVVEELRDQIADMTKQRELPDKARRVTSWDHSFTRRGPDIAALSDIALPDRGDPEQVKSYIRTIASVSQGQNTFSDRDPQIRMLIDLGEESVPVLLESMRHSHGMNDYHIRRAIVLLASEKNKDLILDALPLHPELVSAVLQQGWAADARDTLITELKNTRQYLPTEWIQAVASLRDPETYPLLTEYFVEGQNRAFTYKAIRSLPIENMSEVVERAWKRSKYGDEYARISMAIIALEFGQLDALEALADALTHESTDSVWLVREARPAVLRHTDFRGANSELMQWFRENQEDLEFNPDSRRIEKRKVAEQETGECLL